MIITFNNEFVENARKNMGLSYCKFCKQIGISQTTYKKFLAGNQNLSINTIFKIAIGINAKLKDIVKTK